MPYMADRTYFDPESGCIMDLPERMRTKKGDEVRLRAKAATWSTKKRMTWADEFGVQASVESTAPEGWHELAAGNSAAVEAALTDEHAQHRYGERWNRAGEYAAYRERVEAQFSAPVKQNGDTERAVSIVISGFPASGKSTIGRLIANALLQAGVRVKTQGQRATHGVCDNTDDHAEPKRVRLTPLTEPVEVELWEIDRAAPHNH